MYFGIYQTLTFSLVSNFCTTLPHVAYANILNFNLLTFGWTRTQTRTRVQSLDSGSDSVFWKSWTRFYTAQCETLNIVAHTTRTYSRGLGGLSPTSCGKNREKRVFHEKIVKF